jgi:hypothetical protein
MFRTLGTFRTCASSTYERMCDSSCTCKLDIYFFSVKYVLVSVKLVYVCLKLLKI